MTWRDTVIVLYCKALHSNEWRCIAWCVIALHGVSLHCMEWRGMVLHGMVVMMLHGMATDCIANVVWRCIVCHGVA